MIDDGWTAAQQLGCASAHGRRYYGAGGKRSQAVALIPLSEGTRDISFAPAGSARVRLHQIKPKPYTVDRLEALPAIERFLADVHDVELVWLSDGVDLGRGADFVKALAQAADAHPFTIVTGGTPEALALTAADNAAGALSVKILRAVRRRRATGTVRALDLKGLALGEAPFAFQIAGSRNRGAVRSAG